MSKGTDRRTVRVAPELWEAARAVADTKGETVSDIIRQALEAYAMHGSIYGDSAVRDAIRATYERPDAEPTADEIAFDNDEDRFGPQD